MTWSQGAALKAALFAAVPNIAGLSGVQVTYGQPIRYMANEWIALLDSEGSSEPATISPNRSREETIEQTFLVAVFSGDAQQQQTCTERAFALVEYVVDYCRTTDPTVGGTVRGMLPDVQWALEETQGEKGCLAELAFTLTFNARI